MTDIAGLLERVRAATGPDADLDEAIHVYQSGATAEWQEYLGANRYHKDGSWVYIGPVQPYTASVDAALALVERKLPGWCWGVGNASENAPSRFAAQVRRMGIIEPDHQYHFGPTAPLAILAALLTALSSGDAS